MIVKLTKSSPAARMLRILKDVPEEDRTDVLATVCAAFVQTNGTISNEAKRNSLETVLGPLKRSDRAVRRELTKKRTAGKIGVRK